MNRDRSQPHSLPEDRNLQDDLDQLALLGETINGVPVTMEQVADWVDEAEAGFDIAAMKKKDMGYPGPGAQPHQVAVCFGCLAAATDGSRR